MRFLSSPTTALLPSLVAALALIACGDDTTAPGADVSDDTSEGTGDVTTDTGEPDTADTAVPDTSDDVAEPDAGADTAEPEDTNIEDTVDVSDTADAVEDTADVADATDGSAAADVVTDTGPVIPPLVDCTPGGDECELPYSCIDGACRLPIVGRSMCEDLNDFEIAQPEELTDVFFLLKSLAVDNRFLLLNPLAGADPTRVETEYGAADVEDATEAPIAVSWQTFVRDRLFFNPGPDDPRSWISEEYFYDLNAVVTFTFPGFGTQTAALGFETEQVTLSMILDESGLTADGVLEGYMRRSEAESRVMITAEEAGNTFPTLLCSNTAYRPDDGIWHLSDLLDCNGAPLDHDLDTEDEVEFDSYFVRMEVGFVTASIVAP